MYQADFKRKKNFRRALFSRTTIFIVLSISAVIIWSVINLIPKVQETGQNKREAVNELGRLTTQEETLTLKLDELKTDAGLEAAVREKFRVVKDGEGLIVILNSSDAKAAANGGVGQKLVDFIKNLFK